MPGLCRCPLNSHISPFLSPGPKLISKFGFTADFVLTLFFLQSMGHHPVAFPTGNSLLLHGAKKYTSDAAKNKQEQLLVHPQGHCGGSCIPQSPRTSRRMLTPSLCVGGCAGQHMPWAQPAGSASFPLRANAGTGNDLAHVCESSIFLLCYILTSYELKLLEASRQFLFLIND